MNKILRLAPAFRCVALPLVLLALASVSLFALPPADSQKNWQPDLQKNPQVDYAVIAEMTDAGRALPAATVNKPVYYVSHTMEQHDDGGTSEEAKRILYSCLSSLQKQFANALASYGYRPADKEHPSTQVIFVTWGSCDKIELHDADSDNGDGDSGAAKAANTSFHDNLLTRAKRLGGQKFADEFAQALKENDMKRFSTRDDVTETLVYLIYNGCHSLLVTSLDTESLKNHQKKILWNTTISAVSRELSPTMTPPSLVDMAAYYFGREIDGPEIIMKPAIRSAHPINEATAATYISGSTLIIETDVPADVLPILGKPAFRSTHPGSGTTSDKP